MKKTIMKIQAILIYAAVTVTAALFVLYLGFMTRYYELFYHGTEEMYEFYKQLQVLNKEGFSLILQFVALVLILLAFELQKFRPGLFGLAMVLGSAGYISYKSILLAGVLPKYKRNYLALNFAEIEDYVVSTFAFDAGMVLHYVLVGVLALLAIVVIITFTQRLREGNPLVRKLT